MPLIEIVINKKIARYVPSYFLLFVFLVMIFINIFISVLRIIIPAGIHSIITPIKFQGHCKKYAEQNDVAIASKPAIMIIHASLLFHHLTHVVSLIFQTFLSDKIIILLTTV